MPEIAIILVNWNGIKDTLECLNSLEKINKNKIKVTTIVVDNASKDNSLAELEKLAKNDKIVLLENVNNEGFCGGNNRGMLYALERKFQYILLINNDTTVDKNLIEELVSCAELHPDAGIISPKIYFSKGYEFHKKYNKEELGKVIWYAGGDIDWSNLYATNHGVDKVDMGQFENEREIDFATGACMLIRTSVIEELGGFNENYFAYFEDVELSQRIRNKGYKIIFCPKAKLWHKVSQSSKIGGELNDYFITRNRLLFARHAPLRTKVALARESVKFLSSGRKWQKRAVVDYCLGRLGKGTWGKK